MSVEGETMTVVPGMTVHVPRQLWHSLRNTGTGTLQVVWVSAPQGLEEFFREASRLADGPADPAALQQIAQRYGIEFGNEPQPSPARALGPRSRRRRGGRGRRSGRGGKDVATRGRSVGSGAASDPSPGPSSRAEAAGRAGESHTLSQVGRGAGTGQGGTVSAAEGEGTPGDPSTEASRKPPRSGSGIGSEVAVGKDIPMTGGALASRSSPPIAAQPSSQQHPRGDRGPGRRRRHRGSPGHGRPATGQTQAAAAQRPAPAAQPTRSPAKRPAQRGWRRVKEVYMGGRWVRVTGEGPVISTD